MGTEQERLGSAHPVVVAVDHDENTEDILRFVVSGGGKPHLVTTAHDAYDALMELPGQPSLLVRYQLEGARNMGARLLERLSGSKGLSSVPTIVLNSNPNDTAINDLCYSHYGVNHVIHETEMWANVALIQRIRVESAAGIGAGIMPRSTQKGRESRIFVVHRHEHPEMHRIVGILHRMRVDPIVLPSEAPMGRSVIEAIEQLGDVQLGVVLLTADDHCASGPSAPSVPRARQNVVFEAGYLMGRLKRERVLLLYEEGVELPSDLKGVLYVSLALTDDKLMLRFAQVFYRLKIAYEIKFV